MRRLDEIVSELLAGVALRIENEKAGGTAGEAVPPLTREAGGGNPRMRKGEHHPRSSNRSQPKYAATASAKRETAAP